MGYLQQYSSTPAREGWYQVTTDGDQGNARAVNSLKWCLV